MKNFALNLLFGKDNRVSGLIAFIIVGLIALGCTCNKDFKLDTNSSNSSTPSNTANTSTPKTSNTPDKSIADADASNGKVPSDDQLQKLARETILDFNDAIQKKDFADFHSHVSKPFQKEASPERFNEVFKDFIAGKVDFSEVEDLQATFTDTPSVEKQVGYKTLLLNGTYPTTPRTMKFELKYIPEGKEWKLISIRVSTKD
ncbi:MAG TPA: NTF2-like N-terminal transpeptidase domain-containing protein [Pyrinomonadaceae bacterium]|nr:NTF2-like N-terminal transpeptidase domain-containing protein [Pyrinomonadaceae bacterium]